jgi:hypothetical protein
MVLNIDNKNVKISSMYWDSLGELHKVQADEIIKLGYIHQVFESKESIPIDTDIVLVQGPYGSISYLVKQLMMMPHESRPTLAYWFQQSLQFIGPRYINSHVSKLFSDLYWLQMRNRYGSRSDNHGLGRPSWLRGNRLGFMGDILWLGQNSLLDLLVLSSSVYADYFLLEKIPSLIVSRGFVSGFGQNLELERDIAVLWMGKTRTKRRKELVYGLRDKLESKDLVMRIYDGVENDFIFGEKRTELLNRSRFVLNVNFSDPTDEISIRYFIAAANGAVIIREPNDNKYPFIPGEHLVECHPEEMLDVIEYYLEHPKKRDEIADRMLNLLTSELTLEHSLRKITLAAIKALEKRRGIA